MRCVLDCGVREDSFDNGLLPEVLPCDGNVRPWHNGHVPL